MNIKEKTFTETIKIYLSKEQKHKLDEYIKKQDGLKRGKFIRDIIMKIIEQNS